MRRQFLVLASTVLLAMSVIGSSPGAAEETADRQHCAVYLDRSVDDGQTKPIETEESSIGCFDTLSEAIDAGEAMAPPQTSQQARLGSMKMSRLDDPERGSVHVGTEWNQIQYGGDSKSYFFNRNCNDTPIEVNVGAQWNDRFESGKGFGTCNANKKFRHDNQQGDVELCTPNCWTYGSLNNDVSSLRWKS
ncbi:MAG: hypothetical protein WD739_11035 [Actinomycetota bacterium]